MNYNENGLSGPAVQEPVYRVTVEQYRSVFENTGTAMVIIEEDMTMSMVNAKFEQLTGYSKERIEGRMGWDRFVHEKDVARMRSYHVLRRQMTGPVPTEYECAVVDRQGQTKNILVTIDIIPGTRKSVASFMDITSLKRTEEALAESERRLSTLMANLPGMAYRRRNDARWTLEFVSDGCEALTGYRAETLMQEGGIGFFSLVHPDDRLQVEKTIAGAVGRRKPYEIMYRIVGKDGQGVWVLEKGLGIFSDSDTLLALEGFVTDITARKREELALKKENQRLRSSISERYRFGDIIGKSPAMQRVYETILNAASSSANVIIYGESGTGKELVATAIHQMSDRASRKIVPVNCGAIPETLLESELFGYTRGAFTGAAADKPGLLDLAAGGTIFLDEVGEIALNTQVKLLRAIDGGGYTPVGGSELHTPDVRVIAATHKDLMAGVRAGRMREDFFYRIHVIPVHLPPLRDRKEDIPLLIDHFLQRFSGQTDLPVIPAETMELLMHYDWPGNVRELQNALQRFLTLKKLDFIEPRHRPGVVPGGLEGTGVSTGKDLRSAMELFEETYLTRALAENRYAKKKTAARLGIDRKTLFRKMKKYRLT